MLLLDQTEWDYFTHRGQCVKTSMSSGSVEVEVDEKPSLLSVSFIFMELSSKFYLVLFLHSV